jgi:orotate phosphoribosyltransferase
MKRVEIGHHVLALTPVSLEKGLRAAFTKAAGGWTAAAKQRGLLLNFSRVQWFELEAVVRVVTLVESAVRHGVSVDIALPLDRRRGSEEAWIRAGVLSDAERQITSHVEARARARRFLRTIEFEQALTLEDGAVGVLPVFDDSSDRESTIQRPPRSVAPEALARDYRFCFPLTWLRRDTSVHPRKLAEKLAALASVIGERSRGLETLDADTLTNVIFFELLDNLRHADVERAVVAAWARPATSLPDPKEHPAGVEPYLRWLNGFVTPLIEIFVADSGRGIHRSLTSAYNERHPNNGATQDVDVLLWAFDRWSSGAPVDEFRGTRGLYRVDRIVRRHNGLITVRSSNALAGYDHGGNAYDAPIRQKNLAYQPGTLLSMRLLPVRAVAQASRADATTEESSNISFVPIGSIGKTGLASQDRAIVEAILRRLPRDSPHALVVSVAGGDETPEAVTNALRFCVRASHPVTIVIAGLPGGWSLISNAIDSVNREHSEKRMDVESQGPQYFDIWSPVLVIGPAPHASWVGAGKDTCALLNELLTVQTGHLEASRVIEIVPNAATRATVYQQLRNEVSAVRLRDDLSLHSRIPLSSVITSAATRLTEHIEAGRIGVLDGSFRAPSLHVTNRWIDARVVIDNSIGASIVCTALAHRVYAALGALERIVVFAESPVASNTLAAVGTALGATLTEAFEPISMALGGAESKIAVARSAAVIVYADIVGTGESLYRYVSLLLREKIIPVAILCAIDLRETTTDTLEVSGLTFPLFAVARPASKSGLPNGEPINIDPVTLRPELLLAPRYAPHAIEWPSLAALLREHRALYFSHIERPVGRHFTFYIDAKRLMVDAQVRAALLGAVDDFITHARESDTTIRFEVWYPEPEPKLSTPARTFAMWLQAVKKDAIVRIRPIRREATYGEWRFSATPEEPVSASGVIIVDWGVLGGATLSELLRKASEAGASTVLFCAFLSQVAPEYEAFLSSITELSAPAKGPPLKQVEIPFGSVSRPPITTAAPLTRRVSVDVKFLSQAPFAFYDVHECSLCQRLKTVTDSEPPTSLLRWHRARLLETLQVRSRDAVLADRPFDLFGDVLPPEAPVWMLETHAELERSITSLPARVASADRVRQVRNNKVHARWLARLLTHETHWLQLPPLRFRGVRSELATIGKELATDVDASITDRAYGIRLVRMASKRLFAEHFETIFASVVNVEELQAELLAAVYTQVVRDYVSPAYILTPIQGVIERVSSSVDKGRIRVTAEVRETLHRLKEELDHRCAMYSVADYSPERAWSELGNAFGVEYAIHGQIPEFFRQLLPGPYGAQIQAVLDGAGGAIGEPVLRWIRALESNWSPCRNYLNLTVLPLLSRIGDILRSEEARRDLGHDHALRLAELAASRQPTWNLEFSRLIQRCSADPQEMLTRRTWGRYLSELGFYWDVLLRPVRDNAAAARLLTFLNSAPTDLESAIPLVLAEAGEEFPEVQIMHDASSPACWVFCTHLLTRLVVRELVRNAADHRDKSTGSAPILSLHSTVSGSSPELHATYRHTVLREPGGVGLARLRERLAPFGAQLWPTPNPGGDATFYVKIAFRPGIV